MHKHALGGAIVGVFDLVAAKVVRGPARLSPGRVDSGAERVLAVHAVVLRLVQLVPRLSQVNIAQYYIY